MSNINTFIAAIVNKLSTQFSELNTCVALPGYVESTDITVIHANTPGVFVASVGTGEIKPVETGQSDITLQLVAYLLIVDNNSIQREQTAQVLLTGLVDYISTNGQRWGVAEAHPSAAVESADVHGLTKNFEPHVKDWRLGTAVLARAADLYGATDPISNLALWAITWEQILRVGTDEFDNTGEQVPDDPQFRFDEDDPFITLTTVATGIDFTDIDTDANEIEGTLTIHKAGDETDLTHYNLYWGSGPAQKLANQTVITTIAKTGADVTHAFAANTAIPTGATYLLVYTQNNSIEEPVGINIAIGDVTV